MGSPRCRSPSWGRWSGGCSDARWHGVSIDPRTPDWTPPPMRCLMSLMRHSLAAISACMLIATAPAAAQTALQLRWQLDSDSYQGDDGMSRVTFTLTNRDTKPLPSTGWAIYFSALHSARPGSPTSGFTIEDVTGDLHRLVPGSGFAGLAPGASIRIDYNTDLLLNASFVPKGPYIVFDSSKTVGVPLSDFAAASFARPPQGAGHDARVISPQDQFTLDAYTRDIAVDELPPIFPTPVQVTRSAAVLRLAALPAVSASDGLRAEAGFAADYLRPYFS